MRNKKFILNLNQHFWTKLIFFGFISGSTTWLIYIGINHLVDLYRDQPLG